MSDRENLSKRSIPHMTLARPSETPTPGAHNEITASDTAASRFAAPKTAIVTGGTGALGSAVCLALLQHGCKGIAIFDLNVSSPASQDLLTRLRSSHPDATIIEYDVDVTDEKAVDTAIEDAASRLPGNGGIGALICTAGIVQCAHALDLSVDAFRKIIDVNTVGAFVCARAAARRMITAEEGGRIVFTASISAHRTNFPQPQIGYNVSKGALLMLARSLAAEWARYGIRVNTVSPGYLDTVLNEGEGLAEARDTWCSRNPTGRMGRVEEIAGIILTLVSRAGSYVSGADWVVDGGGTVF
ncbi:sorbitol utilization protein SOU2 [Plectosphaerella plurivora]|uniref:Sorbitol utilization protein SOU2 n=1 Tax=Plectosphaerella plurivora TaxID=936078 RepID=A0A9P9AAC2_9PEZI|nr:sorbitol utilization protein SOU2 [Plectosphaerella plurivora]